MCKHSRLEFIGEQELLEQGNRLYLFNCVSCHTTLSMNEKDPRILKNKVVVKPPYTTLGVGTC